MNRGKRAGITLGVVILLFLIFSQTVWASVDGGALDGATDAYYMGLGTLSMIVQVLIGLGVGGVAMMAVYRTRVKRFFADLFAIRRHSKEGEEREEAE